MAEDYGRLMERVARLLRGEPNGELSGTSELRYGANGSLAVDLGKGAYYDHERKEGGGVLDLIRREAATSDPVGWLREQGLALEDQVHNRVVAEYDYRDETGKLLFQVVRSEPKKFTQRRPATPDDDPATVKHGWVWSVKGVRRVPYSLPDILARPDNPICIVEGEKDVNRLRQLGLLATCNAGGANKWTPELHTWFKGRAVYIIPDNDEAGRSHAKSVAIALRGVAHEVRVLELPGLPEKSDVSDWLDQNHTVDELLTLCRGAASVGDAQPLPTHDHGEEPIAPPRWLIHDRLPEKGIAVLAGRWGTYKTFCALDIAAAVMTGLPYIGEDVDHRGGVLFIAAEGAGDLPIRLAALAEHKIGPAFAAQTELPLGKENPPTINPNRLPFRWAEDCPTLLDEKAEALDRLIATARAADDHFRKQHGAPLVLIIIDTVAAVAGWDDENDNAEAAKVMDQLRQLSDATGALVLVLDHFGKDERTGTRGASAKEAAADAILVTLGERSVSGAAGKLRMAIRKLRAGRAGEEFPFEPLIVDMGRDERGRPITSVIINWTVNGERRTPENRPKPHSGAALDEAIAVALKEHAEDIIVGDTEVMAVERQHVLTAFKNTYRTNAGPGAVTQAFRDALKKAQAIGAVKVELASGKEFLRTDVPV